MIIRNRKIIYIFLLLLTLILLICFYVGCVGVNQASYAQSLKNDNRPDLSSAKSAILIEASSKRVLLERNIDLQLPMASTTKIVTALTVIANCKNLDEQVKIDDRAVGVEGSSIYLTRGEVLTVRQLLYGLMLRSGNDSAVALAIHVGGSVEGFVELMNEKAEQLGLKNTHFDNPNGLPSDTHYTTAYELAVLTAEAYKHNEFAEIVASKKYSFVSPCGKRYVFYNENKLLSRLDGADGVKTGFTKKAGRCFVGSATQDNMRLIAVVLNCGPMFELCQSMLEFGHSQYTMTNIVQQNKVCGVTFFNKSCQKFVLQDGFSYPLLKNGLENDKIKKVIDLPKNANDSGNLAVYFDKQLIFSKKLVTI